jgi:hypothetical protein
VSGKAEIDKGGKQTQPGLYEQATIDEAFGRSGQQASCVR